VICKLPNNPIFFRVCL